MTEYIEHILEQGQRIPDNYQNSQITLSPTGTPQQIKTILNGFRLQATLNGTVILFRKSGLEYQVFYKKL